MKKKLYIALLVCALALASFMFVACGGSSDSGSGTGSTGGNPSAGHTHTMTHKAAQDPTCVQNGNIEYWICTDCGKYFADENGNSEITDKTSVVRNATGQHIYDDDFKCTMCDSELPVTKGLEFALNKDNISYCVKGIGTAIDTQLIIPSEYRQLPVTRIEDGAFENCENLTSIEIPNSITSIGQGVFTGCTQLIEEENGVYYVDNWAIKCYDKTIQEIVWRNGVRGIADWAFYNCNNLQTVEIPFGIKTIAEKSFSDCDKLRNVIIPNSVKSIGLDAFAYSDGISVFTFQGTTAEWKAIIKGLGWAYDVRNYTINCTDGSLGKYD